MAEAADEGEWSSGLESFLPAPSSPAFGGEGFERALERATGQIMDAWSPDEASRLRATVKELQASPRKEWEWGTLSMWLRRTRRLNPAPGSTLAKMFGHIRFMSEHPVAPVKLCGPGPDVVESLCNYLTYREEEEGKGSSALGNDYRAARLLVAFLGLDPKALPAPPKEAPRGPKELLPPPEEIYRLLHRDFGKKDPRWDYRNALMQYLLAFSFGFGPRPPSEVHAMKLAYFEPERHIVHIKRLKGGGRIDRLLIEPRWLCCAHNTLSLANYLRWREKVAERTEEALFVKEDGRGFKSKYGLANLLWNSVPREGAAAFPWYGPYVARHWCATARLIDGGFDYEKVAWWLGHAPQELRDTYDRDARIAKELYGGNWLYRAFYGAPRRSVPSERAGRGVSGQTPSGSEDGLGGIRTRGLMLAKHAIYR